MTKYYDRDGNPVPRHLAVDEATGQVRDGITVHVPQRMCDSATVIVRDTPSNPTDAHAGYLKRMTDRKGGQTAADAIPAKDEGSAHAGYLARMTARPGQERAA